MSGGVPSRSYQLMDQHIEGVELQQNPMAWNLTVDDTHAFPDISRPTSCFFFVSDCGVRLEQLTPRSVVFFSLKVMAPERMHLAKVYFFIDVLRRAHCIDWDRSERTRRLVTAPCDRESRIKDVVWNPSAKFTAVDPDTLIRREADLDRPTLHLFHNKKDALRRDEVWNELNRGSRPGRKNGVLATSRLLQSRSELSHSTISTA
ncbi:hypothetical protein ACVIIV_003030 [Bradyrhizobium sp. USDA 4354]